MATTPTYSWPIPDDTDLVKDGAEAIRDLGNAIDTTVDGLPGAGLVHIETQTVSGATSNSFNDVFSATYDNYKILVSGNTVANSDVQLRLRASGTDATAANYDIQRLEASATTVSAARVNSQTSATVCSFGGSANSNFLSFELANPFIASLTTFKSENEENRSGVGMVRGQRAGFHTLSTSYDGFTLITATNLSAKVSIYGYAKV
jgi:hypothetical protein